MPQRGLLDQRLHHLRDLNIGRLVVHHTEHGLDAIVHDIRERRSQAIGIVLFEAELGGLHAVGDHAGSWGKVGRPLLLDDALTAIAIAHLDPIRQELHVERMLAVDTSACRARRDAALRRANRGCGVGHTFTSSRGGDASHRL